MKNTRLTKLVSMLLAAALIFSALLTMTGCEEHPDETVMILAKRSNSESVDPNSDFIRDAVKNVVENYGVLKFISIESKPRNIGTLEFKKPSDPFKLASIKEKENNERLNEALSVITKIKARSPEADPLKSLRLASESFSENAPHKHIIMVDNMLPTAGEASFANGYFLDAAPEVIASLLEENNAIPDLKGIDITIVITPTADNQTELSDSERECLKAIWHAVLEKSGVRSFEVLTKSCTKATDHSKLPAVSTVMTIPSSGLHPDCFKDITVFSETDLSFVQDSTEFIDPESAAEALDPIIKRLQQDKKLKIVVAGTCATVLDSKDKCVGFSLRRAKKVKALMVAKDKSLASRIAVKGLGYENDFHTPDMLDGKQIQDEAQKNRLVIIADVTSDTGKRIMG